MDAETNRRRLNACSRIGGGPALLLTAAAIVGHAAPSGSSMKHFQWQVSSKYGALNREFCNRSPDAMLGLKVIQVDGVRAGSSRSPARLERSHHRLGEPCRNVPELQPAVVRSQKAIAHRQSNRRRTIVGDHRFSGPIQSCRPCNRRRPDRRGHGGCDWCDRRGWAWCGYRCGGRRRRGSDNGRCHHASAPTSPLP
jgi:hypothetical protein